MYVTVSVARSLSCLFLSLSLSLTLSPQKKNREKSDTAEEKEKGKKYAGDVRLSFQNLYEMAQLHLFNVSSSLSHPFFVEIHFLFQGGTSMIVHKDFAYSFDIFFSNSKVCPSSLVL